MQNYLNRIPNYIMLGYEFYSNLQTKTFCYVSIHLRSHINNSSSCLTGISKHSKTMYENIRASRSTDVFSYIVFSCLDIPVKHSLSLFIYYIKPYIITTAILFSRCDRFVHHKTTEILCKCPT